jgi:hypothetical protein
MPLRRGDFYLLFKQPLPDGHGSVPEPARVNKRLSTS